MAGDDRDQDEFTYYLVETALRVSAEATVVYDAAGNPGDPELSDVSIDLINRADPDERRTVALTGKGALWNVSSRSDGALAAISNANTPQGPAAVRVATNVVQLAGTLASAGLAAGGSLGGLGSLLLGSPPATVPVDTGTPPKREDDKPKLSDLQKAAALLEEATTLAEIQRAKLRGIANVMVTASDPLPAAEQVAEFEALAKMELALQTSLTKTEIEIGRLTSLVQLLKSKGQTKVTYTMERVVPIRELLPTQDRDAVPSRSLDKPCVIQDEFGLFVRRVDPRPVLGGNKPASAHIEWREPRHVEIIVAQEKVEAAPYVVKRLTVPVVDEYSLPRFFIFDDPSRMRTEDVSITFGDLGQLQSLSLARTTGLSAAADALGAAAPAVGQTIGEVSAAATARQERIASRQSAAQVAKAKIDHEIAMEKSRLELAGLHATADDFVQLRKLEQAAAIAKATQGLTPPAE